MKWLWYEPDSLLHSTVSVIRVTEELETPSLVVLLLWFLKMVEGKKQQTSVIHSASLPISEPRTIGI